MSLANEESRFQNKGVLLRLVGPSLWFGLAYGSLQTLDIQAESDIIDTQSGSAGEHPDRTKGRAVFSSENRGPFAFSIPFVQKTHLPFWRSPAQDTLQPDEPLLCNIH